MGRFILERILVLGSWGVLLLATNGCDPVWTRKGMFRARHANGRVAWQTTSKMQGSDPLPFGSG